MLAIHGKQCKIDEPHSISALSIKVAIPSRLTSKSNLLVECVG